MRGSLPEIKADFLTALARKGETVGEIGAWRGNCAAGRSSRRSILELAPSKSWTFAAPGATVSIPSTSRQPWRLSPRLTAFRLPSTATGPSPPRRAARTCSRPLESKSICRRKMRRGRCVIAISHFSSRLIITLRSSKSFRRGACAGNAAKKRSSIILGRCSIPRVRPYRLIGLPHPHLCLPIATVLQSLDVRRGMVVSGSVPPDGDKPRNLDELSTLGENTVVEFHQPCALAASSLFPENFPIQPATLSDLAGGDCQRNAEIVRRVLGGEELGPKRDAVLLNAAAALFVAEKSRSLAAGWERAAQIIDSGQALAKLEELIAFH